MPAPLFIRFSLLLLFSCTFFCGNAQSPLIAPYIKAWQVSDTSQTHRAEETYAWLKADSSYSKYQRIVGEMENYLARNPDDRLTVRLAMYDMLGKFEYHREGEITRQDSLRMAACLGLIERLNDEQLKAEFYTIYARLLEGNSYLLYNLKAVELQRKIGFERFNYVYNRLFTISLSLYHTGDYKQSIRYGRECLRFRNVDQKYWDPMVYIFQLDMLGVSYLKLGRYDSTRYYYGQIIDTLQKKPIHPDVQHLWLGIARGNIGHTLILQGNEKQGLPMVRFFLEKSIAAGSNNNMAIAQNMLAEIDLKHRRYSEALAGARKAYVNSERGNTFEQKILAARIIADSYQAMGRLDSAIRYYDRYHTFRAERTASENEGKLSVMKARIAFDDMQYAFQNTRKQLEKEQQTRNFILAGMVLLTIISLLLYSRQRLKAKHREDLLMHEKQWARIETEAAREQVRAFSRNIHDKEKLIRELSDSVQNKNEFHQQQAIQEKLAGYILITDQEWSKFKEVFARAYPAFFPMLRKQLPSASPAEERLASLVYLHLDDNRIAGMLGISKDSVKRSRTRLKNRLGLGANQSLVQFISALD